MANPYAHHARKTGLAKMRALGGRAHSDVAQDRKLIKSMLDEHEKKEMKVEGSLRHSGLKAHGKARGGRLDKPRRDKGGVHKKSKINIMAPPVPATDPGLGAPSPTPMPPPGMSSGPLPNVPGMRKGGKLKTYARGGAVGGHKFIKMKAGKDSGVGRLELTHKQPKLRH